MKTFLTTAAMIAALTLPAFAEGDTTGSEALGEANGSFKLSKQDPGLGTSVLIGSQSMAQGRLARAEVSGSSSISTRNEGLSFTAASSGMDGGNRK